MTLFLYAQPYDSSVEGFYFRSTEEYEKIVHTIKNGFGQPIEEFEIQFIDGEDIDCELAKAIGLSQANFNPYFDFVEAWDDWQKQNVIIAVGECGYPFDENTLPDSFDIEIYQEDSLRDLAIQFVDDGLFGDIPESFQPYIDYDAIARDLSMDYSEITIAERHLIYRCS